MPEVHNRTDTHRHHYLMSLQARVKLSFMQLMSCLIKANCPISSVACMPQPHLYIRAISLKPSILSVSPVLARSFFQQPHFLFLYSVQYALTAKVIHHALILVLLKCVVRTSRIFSTMLANFIGPPPLHGGMSLIYLSREDPFFCPVGVFRILILKRIGKEPN